MTTAQEFNLVAKGLVTRTSATDLEDERIKTFFVKDDITPLSIKTEQTLRRSVKGVPGIFSMSSDGLGRLKAEYSGRFIHDINSDKVGILKLLRSDPAFIRLFCQDKDKQLIGSCNIIHMSIVCDIGIPNVINLFVCKNNVLIPNINGETMLHYACYSNNVEIVLSVFNFVSREAA